MKTLAAAVLAAVLVLATSSTAVAKDTQLGRSHHQVAKDTQWGG